MREIVLFIILLGTLVGLLITYRRMESKRMKKKILDAMSPSLRKEIEDERRQNLAKKQKFDEAMNVASGERSPSK